MQTNDSLTLINAAEGQGRREWTMAQGDAKRLIRVPNFNAFSTALRTGLHEYGLEIERAIVDGTVDVAGFMRFLCEMPTDYRGDVLFIAPDGGAFLSAAGRDAARHLYALQPADLEFYLEVHDLSARTAPAVEIDVPLPEPLPYQPNFALPKQNVRPRTVDGAPLPVALIADDDKRSRAILSEVVMEAGLEPVFACDGVEAIRIAETLRPAVVLLDGLMPAMHGFEVARFIRHIDANYTPAIAIATGVYKGLRYQNEAKLKYGIDAYFLKPVQRAMLLPFLQRIGFGSGMSAEPMAMAMAS